MCVCVCVCVVYVCVCMRMYLCVCVCVCVSLCVIVDGSLGECVWMCMPMVDFNDRCVAFMQAYVRLIFRP